MSTALVQCLRPRRRDELRAAVHREADLVEVRADDWEEPLDSLVECIASLPLPAIATLRAPGEGGSFTGTEEERLRRLRVLAAAAHLVDVEWRTPASRQIGDGARLIASHHDFEGMPRDLPGLLAAMRREVPAARYLKVAVTPGSGADLVEFVRAALAAPPEATLIALGPRGRFSRILARRLHSCFLYASTPGQEPTGPGQLALDELLREYRVREHTPATAIHAVVGTPLAHTRSPAVHNAGFAALGRDAVYVALEVERLDEALELARLLDLEGLSVTIPFKEDAARVVAEWHGLPEGSPAPRACNTLLRRAGRWRGANTDAAGFREALRRQAPELRLKGSAALVLGAGGAARSVVEVLVAAGARCSIHSRTADRARLLARETGAAAVSLDAETVRRHALVVNATPVGMEPDVEGCPVPPEALHRGQVVFDLVYRPRETRLLREARARGAHCVSGEEMFLLQAFAQFELFTGAPAPEDVLRAAFAATASR